jgi:NADH-quinone oxidoreductase subunit L
VFVTAFYSFRMVFLVFHGKERFGQPASGHHGAGHDDHDHDHGHGQHHGLSPGQKPHESPLVVTLPLILLAIPSLLIGFYTVEPMLFGDFFSNVIATDSGRHPAMSLLKEEWHGAVAMGVHAFTSLPFWLALAGVVSAWYLYLINPALPVALQRTFAPLHHVLEQKYYFDRFNEFFFAGGSRLLGRGLWKAGDQALIDGVLVNGSWRLVGFIARSSRVMQTGYLYHYAIAMILGVAVMLFWFVPLLSR